MQVINNILSLPLGWLFQLSLSITGTYGLAIILLTFFTKLILFPISMWVQKNAVRMARLKPELDEIKLRYAGDKDKIADEQLALFKREKYNPFSAVVPIFLQIPIVIGLIYVLRAVELPATWGPSWLLPLLAVVATFLMCVAQNHLNPFQAQQSALSRWGMTIAITLFVVWFVSVTPISLSLYWAASNFMQIGVMALANALYNPRKYIDQQRTAQKPKLSKEEQAKQREYRKREKAHISRFYRLEPEEKQLVFISPSSGYYKYYKNFIAYILENSDIVIHYITSDPNDQVFGREELQVPQFAPYYVGDNALISFMMKMEASMVVMTMPDLGQYHIKRSWLKKDIEYVFADHSMNSVHMVFREGALDYYDTIFCVHSQYMDEVRASEKLYGTKEKKLVPVGYNLIDDLIAQYESLEPKSSDGERIILVAPSWQKDNILELCLEPLLEQLMGKGNKVIVRPHPEFTKRFPDKMKQIIQQYDGLDDYKSGRLVFEIDFTSSTSIFTSEMLITDWSAIAIEFSYTTLKPSLFVNTPPKIMNPNYKKIPIVPLDIALRDLLGVSVDMDKLNGIADIVEDMFARQDDFREQILATREKYLFNLGTSGEAGGKYIVETLSNL